MGFHGIAADPCHYPDVGLVELPPRYIGTAGDVEVELGLGIPTRLVELMVQGKIY